MAHSSNTKVDYTALNSVEVYGGVTYANTFVGTKSVQEFTLGSTARGDGKRPLPHSFYGIRRYGVSYHYHAKLDDSGHTIEQDGRVLTDTGHLTVPADHGAYVSSTSIIPNVQNDAYTKLFEKLRGDANLAVDLAEAKETKAMLRNFVLAAKRINLYRKNPAELLRDVISATKGGPRKWPPNVAKTSANAWMQYRYGIMPLVYSTYDILKTHVMSPLGGVQTVKGRARTVENSLAVISANYLSETITEELSVRSQYVCTFLMDGKKHVYDWTSLDPASIAWELFPLSFVGDWFVNVSQVLELIDNRRVFADRFLYGCETTTTRRKSRCLAIKELNPGYPATTFRAENMTVAFTKARSVLEELPFPHKPSVQVKLNAKRFTDAAALIYQGFSSKKR